MEISIDIMVQAPLEKVWKAWVTPQDIMQWNFASDAWCCPHAEIDLTEGGRFNYRMEEKGGSMGFDFEGTFTKIHPNYHIEYVLDDDRKVQVTFTPTEIGIQIKETFDAENEHTADQQRQGWLNILTQFKLYVESQS